MIRSLLARQARRHAAVLACLGAAFMLVGAPGAGAVETPSTATTAGTAATAVAVGKAAAMRTVQAGDATEPMPESRTSLLLALGLAATAFMARRRN